MQDPDDDTVIQFSCLMAGVATELSKTNYDSEEYRTFYDSLHHMVQYEQSLFGKLTDEDLNVLNEQMLQSIQEVEQDQSRFYNRESFKDDLEENNFKGRSSSVASAAGEVKMSFIRDRELTKEERTDFHNLIHALVVMLTETSAGIFSMQSVLGIVRPPDFDEFKQFLQIMEVYGCGYIDDVDYSRYNTRATQTHRQTMIE